MSIVDELHRAREAYERREWVATYRALSDLDGADLRPDDFMALGTTAYLLGRRNDCVQAAQRAYQAYLDQGETLGAVRAACALTLVLWMGGEVAVGGSGGHVPPIAAGRVYCSTIETCQGVSDLGRASEWTHALTTWCDDQPGLVAFTGQCAVHRGQLMRFHGAYPDALEE